MSQEIGNDEHNVAHLSAFLSQTIHAVLIPFSVAWLEKD